MGGQGVDDTAGSAYVILLVRSRPAAIGGAAAYDER
jgi:hypothetical protein